MGANQNSGERICVDTGRVVPHHSDHEDRFGPKAVIGLLARLPKLLSVIPRNVTTGEVMTTTISTHVPNSIILISGGNGTVPEVGPPAGISATSTMIAVGTLSEIDGPTQITLAQRGDMAIDMKLVFVGELYGIAGKLLVETCLGEVLLEVLATSPVSTVEVFANDASEPDNILIMYSASS